MTNPGWMGQQAQRQQEQHNRSAAFHRQAAYHDQRRRRNRSGLGLFGRLVGLVFTLVTIAVAVGIFLLILSQAQPSWFDSITSWFENTF